MKNKLAAKQHSSVKGAFRILLKTVLLASPPFHLGPSTATAYTCKDMLERGQSDSLSAIELFEKLSKEYLQEDVKNMKFYFFISKREQLELMEHISSSESFTVLLTAENKLVIEMETPGDSNWQTGSSGSHKTLLNLYNSAVGGLTDFSDRAGSIRFRSNGSIDVSGYHETEKNIEAARAIRRAIKKIAPNAKFQITGDRLSKFDD